MEPVNVLPRIDAFENRVFVDVFRKRKLNENAVDRIVFIQFANFLKQLLRRDGAWHRELTALDPKLFASLRLHVYVCGRRRIVADENNGEAGMNTLLFEPFNFRRDFALDVLSDFRSVNKSSSHNAW